MSNFKHYGWPAFLSGGIIALICAAKLPDSNILLTDILMIYLLAIILMTIGLLLLWMSESFAINAVLSLPLNIPPPLQPELQHLVNVLESSQSQLDGMDSKTVLSILEQFREELIRPLILKQPYLLTQFGIQRGIRITAEIALGERYLNRACSAAADNCVSESLRVYPPMLAAFQRALAEFNTP